MAKRRTDNTMAKRRTDNTMAKSKGQTTQWPKVKDRQHNGQKKKSTKGQTPNYTTLHKEEKIWLDPLPV